MSQGTASAIISLAQAGKRRTTASSLESHWSPARLPKAGAIPWLVLRAKSHAGDGLFAKVAYIVRSATEGGSAPTAGCDAAHVGAEARVGYRATYTFFPG